jgi:hypothetical protein
VSKTERTDNKTAEVAPQLAPLPPHLDPAVVGVRQAKANARVERERL